MSLINCRRRRNDLLQNQTTSRDLQRIKFPKLEFFTPILPCWPRPSRSLPDRRGTRKQVRGLCPQTTSCQANCLCRRRGQRADKEYCRVPDQDRKGPCILRYRWLDHRRPTFHRPPYACRRGPAESNRSLPSNVCSADCQCKTNKLQYIRSFFSLTMEPQQSLHEYASRILSSVNQLGQVGVHLDKIDEDFKLSVLLEGLTDDYMHVRRSLYMRLESKEKLTWSAATAVLNAEHERLQNDPPSTAFHANSSRKRQYSRQNGPPCSNCGYDGHQAEDCRHSRNPPR